MMPAWVGRLRTHGTSSASLPSPLRINMFGPVGTAGTVETCGGATGGCGGGDDPGWL